MRLAQPTASVGNLNRHHGSQSGLRPPTVLKAAIRPQIGSRVNGASLIRPQSQLKGSQSQSGYAVKATMEAPAVSAALQTGLVTFLICFSSLICRIYSFIGGWLCLIFH